jgi:hypothetical protein
MTLTPSHYIFSFPLKAHNLSKPGPALVVRKITKIMKHIAFVSASGVNFYPRIGSSDPNTRFNKLDSIIFVPYVMMRAEAAF